MTDAEKHEKAIRGLESLWMCISPVSHTCWDCPYQDNRVECKRRVVKDAIALLREQEARVMTLKELQAIGMSWNRNTPPYLFVERRSLESRWMSWGFMHDFVRLWGTMNAKNYGSKWRVWNLQPTPEQMRDTPWEPPKEEDDE